VVALAACAADENEDDCPTFACAMCGDPAAWFVAPGETTQARIGEAINVTVAARSNAGLASLGFVALGDLAGVPLQLAHETANATGRSETNATFEFVVPFNANLTRIVLIALGEDNAGRLATQARVVTVNPYP